MKITLLLSLIYINFIFAGLIDGFGFYGGLTRTGVNLSSNVVIEHEVQILNGVRIGSNTIIEEGSIIGSKSVIKANVTVHKYYLKITFSYLIV